MTATHYANPEMPLPLRLKPVRDQVIVITGASSGIGLVTARLAARKGARVVLTARNNSALKQLARELDGDPRCGGGAAAVAADVADDTALRRVADEAIRRFGRIDTWVNGAGVSIYGRAMDVSLEDQRRLFETNVWGVINGSRIAVEHLREQGGALINVGSTLSDYAIPLQAAYSASKHAVKAYTDALRMELEHDRLPISVTLIKPYSIDTPYIRNAKNYLANEPAHPPPVYSPAVVADAIVHCAAHPVRHVFAGGSAKVMAELSHHAPRMTDKMMETVMFDLQQSGAPEHDRSKNSLYGPASELKERGGHAGHVVQSSLYTQVSLRPWMAGAMVALAGLTLASLVGGRTDATAERRPARTSELF